MERRHTNMSGQDVAHLLQCLQGHVAGADGRQHDVTVAQQPPQLRYAQPVHLYELLGIALARAPVRLRRTETG